MKASLLLILIILTSVSQANVYPVGTWQFPDRDVYIEILENGNTFQCRIDTDQSIIRAIGKYDGDENISWLPVEIESKNGTLRDSDGFSWEEDKISISKGKLTLTGQYGSFTYIYIPDDIPAVCRK